MRLLSTNFLPQRSRRPFYDVTSKKRSSCVFVQTLGAIFWRQTTLGAIFARIFRDFRQFKTFEDVVATLHPRLLYHCLNQWFSTFFGPWLTTLLCWHHMNSHVLHIGQSTFLCTTRTPGGPGWESLIWTPLASFFWMVTQRMMQSYQATIFTHMSFRTVKKSTNFILGYGRHCSQRINYISSMPDFSEWNFCDGHKMKLTSALGGTGATPSDFYNNNNVRRT